MKQIEFEVPLHLDPPGLRRIMTVWTTVQHVRRTLATYIQAQALGQPCSVRTAAAPAFRLPAVPADRLIQVPRLEVARLQRAVRSAATELGWSRHLPINTLDLIAEETLRELRHLPHTTPVPFSALPAAWPEGTKPVIPLRGGLRPLGVLQVAIGLLGDAAVQHCDLFPLPARYEQAVRDSAARRQVGELERLGRAEGRLFAGEVAALADVMRLAGRLQPWDLEAGPPAAPASTDLPVLTDRFTLRQILGAEDRPAWTLTLRFKVAGSAFQRAWIDDTVGVDLGADELVTWASLTRAGRVVVPVLHGPLPSAPAHMTGQTPRAYDHRLAAAAGRQALLRCVRPGYEHALNEILQHRHVALEDTRWSGFTRTKHGFYFPEFARLAHLHTFTHWLFQLAPLHGSQLSPVDPTDSSSIYYVCGRPGQRPQRGEPFKCRYDDCRAWTPSHFNAARVLRLRGLPLRRLKRLGRNNSCS